MKITKTRLIIFALLILASLKINAQDGMDYNGPALFRFSGLRDDGGSALMRVIQDEKALGVYQTKGFTPLAFLEVNTNVAYMPFPMPGLPLGEVFRTNSGTTNSTWRMFRQNVEYGLLQNNANNNFEVQATQGSLQFNTGGANERMIILGTNGNVGIGRNFVTPNNRLDVDSGDIDVNVIKNGYMIADQYVVRHNGIVSNIYIGVGAGNTTSASLENTFVGNNAGTSITTGNSNTFVGHNAGFNTSNAVRCTFMGDSAGYANTTGRWNSFVGYACGVKNTIGENNAFYGKHCGPNNINGNRNSFFGNHAGEGMKDGNCNVIIGNDAAFSQMHGDSSVIVGHEAGRFANPFASLKGNAFLGASAGGNNATGNLNTFLGFKSGNDAATGSNNSCAIGARAQVTSSNKMILGDSNVWVGIGVSHDLSATLGPGNSLEINARTNTTGTIIANKSGLRFRQLTAASPAAASNGKVLTVDASGDVILTTCCSMADSIFANNGTTVIGSDTVQWGQPNSGTGALNGGELIHDTEIPTNGKNTIFYGFGTAGVDRFAIGRAAPVTIRTKHYIYNNIEDGAVVAETDGSAIPVTGTAIFGGIGGRIFGVSDPTTQITAIGMLGAANNPLVKENIGVRGRAINCVTVNYGVQGEAVAASSGINVGVYGQSIRAATGTNYGGYFIADSSSSGNYGVFAQAPASGGIGGPDYAGFFNGDLVYTGSFGFSDKRLKKDINKIENSLDIIKKLKPVTYLYDTDNHKNISLSSKKQYGFIAQEIKEVLPELTSPIVVPASYDSNGKKATEKEEYIGINYNGFIAILTEALQEQQKEIEELKSIIAANASGPVNNSSSTAVNQSEITLKDNDVIVLEQNVPNPFAEQTVISYNLPENVAKAQMLFYNADGKLINSMELTQKGRGQVTVFASDLSNGSYNYTLVVDGKVVDTKKMIKSK